MDELKDYLAALVEEFRTQPARWLERIEGLDKERLGIRSDADAWTAHQVSAHVMAADRHALLPRLRRILNEEHPELPNWDEAAWMAQTYDHSVALEPELGSWQQAREGLAQEFSELELSDWNRSGSHPLRGERTLLWWLEYCVHHTQDHRLQLQKTLAGAGFAEETL